MKIRIVFKPVDGPDTVVGLQDLLFQGVFGEDGEEIKLDPRFWMADGDVEALELEVPDGFFEPAQPVPAQPLYAVHMVRTSGTDTPLAGLTTVQKIRDRNYDMYSDLGPNWDAAMVAAALYTETSHADLIEVLELVPIKVHHSAPSSASKRGKE